MTGPDPTPEGPLDTAPDGFLGIKMQRATLLAELTAAGVELGAYDRLIVDWLGGWDYPTVATVASLIRRAARGPK
jgi:hypothetical protein